MKRSLSKSYTMRTEYPPARGRESREPRESREGSRGRFFRKKTCRFCAEKGSLLNYKEVERLGKFLTEKGKIIGRRITGNCAKHQRVLAAAIKRARHAALLPFLVD